jgi:hypothetical protein
MGLLFICFNLNLKQREGSPRKLGAMANLRHFIYRTALHQVPANTVGMVGGFLAGPMKRLPGVVLLVSDKRNLCDRRQCVREVID